ncbi:tyrosine-type recombinase/integrase [Metaclostridioides mangenotii]|uniref:tyrosine-type recombinase/integrase n=1 Tax=Metaclostridioides mangenotii TaxID=1540 RepID=UPI002FDDF219
MKFHALRHSYATRIFEAGVPPKTVQPLIAYYDINITMDIYTHVMGDSKLQAVEKTDGLFNAKIYRWSYGGQK